MISLMTIMSGGGEISEQVLGYEYLVSNARAFWDFKNVSSNGYEDLTGNGYDLNGVASPLSFTVVPFEYRDVDNTTRNIARVTLSDAPMLATGNQALFHNDHELHFSFCGRVFSNKYLLGTYGGTSARTYTIYIDNNGDLIISLLGSVYTTTNAIFRGTGSDLRRAMNRTYIRLRVDFTNDLLRLWVNGGEVPLTLTSGSGISSMSPTGFSQDIYPFPFGAGNNINSTVGVATYYTDCFYAAVTELLSTSNFYNVSRMMLS